MADTNVKNRSRLFAIISAILFFVFSASQIVVLIFQLSMSYRDPRRWTGISGFMEFNNFAFPIILAALIGIFLLTKLDKKCFGITLSIFAGAELLFGIYFLMKKLDIYPDAAIHTDVLIFVFAALAIISLIAFSSMKGIENNRFKYVFCGIPAVLMIVSAIFNFEEAPINTGENLSLFFSKLAHYFDIYVSPIFLAAAFVMFALAFVTKTKNDENEIECIEIAKEEKIEETV